jgi:hypothetical protein
MDGFEGLEKLGSGSFGTIRRIVRKSDQKVCANNNNASPSACLPIHTRQLSSRGRDAVF